MTTLLAYVGPGAGLGFLGSLLAVLAVIAVGLLGLVIYPLKLALVWYRGETTAQSLDESVPCRTQAGSV
jgi:hypothetical protein